MNWIIRLHIITDSNSSLLVFVSLSPCLPPNYLSSYAAYGSALNPYADHDSSHRGNIKDNKLRWSVYGQEGDNNRGAIFCNKGIDLTHVMASGAFPTTFDYEKIDGRGFWDRGILSNTPLRELIQKHRDYWYKDLEEQEVPDLELYIVNVWPSKEATNQLPVDYDSLKDRRNDLTYHDKTGYDTKVAEMVNDYIDYIKALRVVAQEGISSIQNAAKREKLTERLEGIGRPETKSSKKYCC